MKDGQYGWHVLYVKSQHEKKVNTFLKSFGLNSFLPTVVTVRQWSDRKKTVIVPLFPSYVFLNVSSIREFHDALKIKGVYRFLRFGDEYAKIRDEEIHKIKQFLKLDGISEVETTFTRPRKGEKMVINYGELQGLKCEVLKVNNKNKILVRIESLKRDIIAVVPPDFLSTRKVI